MAPYLIEAKSDLDLLELLLRFECGFALPISGLSVKTEPDQSFRVLVVLLMYFNFQSQWLVSNLKMISPCPNFQPFSVIFSGSADLSSRLIL